MSDSGKPEVFYRTLLENIFEGIVIADLHAVIGYHNQAAADILQARPGELTGMNGIELVHPADRDRAREFLQNIATNAGITHPIELRLLRLDGTSAELLVRAVNLSDDPAVGGMLVNFRDLSQERQAAKALQRSEERLELALRGAGLGLWDYAIPSEVITYDERWAAMLGYEVEELGSTRAEWFELIHADDQYAAQEAIDAHLRGDTEFIEIKYRLLAKTGVYRWVVARGRVVERNAAGEPVRVSGTHRDVDAQERAEAERRIIAEQLQQAQKIESIGLLAGGIAHDFNNMLQVILAQARLAALALESGKGVEREIDEIERAGARAAELTRQLLAFGRRQSIRPRAVSLNELLRRLLSMLERLLPAAIEIDFIPGHKLASAFVDPGQFEQVITNLCLNARDAMPGGGRLTLETENIVINGEYRKKHPWARAGRYVLVTVTDTGEGMDPEQQRRAFEPFYTTKESGEGTGLGLAMVYGIVRQHEGMVHLYSEKGVGTTFKLFWPVAERMADNVGSKLEGAVPTGAETVLIAEDEDMVRSLVARILESAGYRVLVAENGQEAVELYKEHQAEVALLVLDVVMPKLGGRETYEAIHAMGRPVPTLFTSGYSAASLPAQFLAERGLEVLPKPYSPDALLRKVRETLGTVPIPKR